jgi:hypothetical protein
MRAMRIVKKLLKILGVLVVVLVIVVAIVYPTMIAAKYQPEAAGAGARHERQLHFGAAPGRHS